MTFLKEAKGAIHSILSSGRHVPREVEPWQASWLEKRREAMKSEENNESTVEDVTTPQGE